MINLHIYDICEDAKAPGRFLVLFWDGTFAIWYKNTTKTYAFYHHNLMEHYRHAS